MAAPATALSVEKVGRALRRARRDLRHELHGRRRRDRQPDRARTAPARPRPSTSSPAFCTRPRATCSYRGTALNGSEAAPDRRPRPDPHVSAHQRFPERHRARQRADRAASPGPGRRCSNPFWRCRVRASSRAATCGNARSNWSNGSASNAAPTTWRARCPTASSACVGVALALAARAVDAAARRAGVGHECLGNPQLRATDPQHPGSRRHHPAGRARHADGDERLRPDRGAQLRPHHRRRYAGR